jgi:hypothetical protein
MHTKQLNCTFFPPAHVCQVWSDRFSLVWPGSVRPGDRPETYHPKRLVPFGAVHLNGISWFNLRQQDYSHFKTDPDPESDHDEQTHVRSNCQEKVCL